MPLQLVDVVSAIATVTVVVMELGPAPSVLQIHKTKSTGVTPLVPLASLSANGWIWTLYGSLTDNIFPVAVSNFVGAVLGAIYATMYFRYSVDRVYAAKVIGTFGLLMVLATAYVAAALHGLTNQSREQAASVAGYMGVATVFIFFSSPFENIAQVFRYRSAVFIPIVLVVTGALNSAMWSLYSLLIRDWFIFVPNFGALLIGCAQIALYLAFRGNAHSVTEIVRGEKASLLPKATSKLELPAIAPAV